MTKSCSRPGRHCGLWHIHNVDHHTARPQTSAVGSPTHIKSTHNTRRQLSNAAIRLCSLDQGRDEARAVSGPRKRWEERQGSWSIEMQCVGPVNQRVKGVFAQLRNKGGRSLLPAPGAGSRRVQARERIWWLMNGLFVTLRPQGAHPTPLLASEPNPCSATNPAARRTSHPATISLSQIHLSSLANFAALWAGCNGLARCRALAQVRGLSV